MISSQDGTDARRDRPPAAFLTGRSRAGPGSPSAAAGPNSAGWRSASGSRAPGPAWPGPAGGAVGLDAAAETGEMAGARGSG
jgi:hypothetical protein